MAPCSLMVTADGASPCHPHLCWMLCSLLMQCGALLRSREHLVQFVGEQGSG